MEQAPRNQIIGLGNDIIDINRIKEAILKHKKAFLEKIFSPKEQEYCFKFKDPYPRLAGRFAAKEAIVKALGTGFVGNMSWSSIEILADPSGKPIAILPPELLKTGWSILISISHCKTSAIATAILTN